MSEKKCLLYMLQMRNYKKKKLFVVTANEKKPETYTLKTKRIYIYTSIHTTPTIYINVFSQTRINHKLKKKRNELVHIQNHTENVVTTETSKWKKLNLEKKTNKTITFFMYLREIKIS